MTILLIALLGIAVVVTSILWLKLNPFLGLVLGSLVILLLTPSEKEVASRLAAGMSEVFQKIGLPIVFASIVGGCLLESGAATRIVQSIVGVFGMKRLAPSLSVSAFLMAIPVYFDTVFYLLLPLAKAVARDKPASYMLSVMAIIVGATMAHSLVPPTPGPLLVASALQVPMATMMVGGIIVGGLVSTIGFFYGVWCSRTMILPIHSAQKIESQATFSTTKLPPVWLSAMPLVVPMAMIVAAEVFLGRQSSGASAIWKNLGDPTVALLIAALIGIITLHGVRSKKESQSIVSRSIADAGMIILLTCAGGGFGVALKELGVGPAIVGLFPGLKSPTGLLVMAFGTTAIIRAAQGSATVAMTTTVEIIKPLLATMDLPFHPVYVALAIGCGSKPFAWMNDSGFWQVATMTGMTALQTLKTFSAALTIMGFCGLVLVLTGSWLLPFK